MPITTPETTSSSSQHLMSEEEPETWFDAQEPQESSFIVAMEIFDEAAKSQTIKPQKELSKLTQFFDSEDIDLKDLARILDGAVSTMMSADKNISESGVHQQRLGEMPAPMVRDRWIHLDNTRVCQYFYLRDKWCYPNDENVADQSRMLQDAFCIDRALNTALNPEALKQGKGFDKFNSLYRETPDYCEQGFKTSYWRCVDYSKDFFGDDPAKNKYALMEGYQAARCAQDLNGQDLLGENTREMDWPYDHPDRSTSMFARPVPKVNSGAKLPPSISKPSIELPKVVPPKTTPAPTLISKPDIELPKVVPPKTLPAPTLAPTTKPLTTTAPSTTPAHPEFDHWVDPSKDSPMCTHYQHVPAVCTTPIEYSQTAAESEGYCLDGAILRSGQSAQAFLSHPPTSPSLSKASSYCSKGQSSWYSYNRCELLKERILKTDPSLADRSYYLQGRCIKELARGDSGTLLGKELPRTTTPQAKPLPTASPEILFQQPTSPLCDDPVAIHSCPPHLWPKAGGGYESVSSEAQDLLCKRMIELGYQPDLGPAYQAGEIPSYCVPQDGKVLTEAEIAAFESQFPWLAAHDKSTKKALIKDLMRRQTASDGGQTQAQAQQIDNNQSISSNYWEDMARGGLTALDLILGATCFVSTIKEQFPRIFHEKNCSDKFNAGLKIAAETCLMGARVASAISPAGFGLTTAAGVTTGATSASILGSGLLAGASAQDFYNACRGQQNQLTNTECKKLLNACRLFFKTGVHSTSAVLKALDACGKLSPRAKSIGFMSLFAVNCAQLATKAFVLPQARAIEPDPITPQRTYLRQYRTHVDMSI